MGTPSYATEIFKSLNEVYDVMCVFTQMDKKGNRNKITPPHIKQYIIDNDIKVKLYQPKKLRDDDNVEIIKSLKPDFIIVAAYGAILSQEILDIAPCINLHASLLPKYRGASPIQSYILSDDKLSGVSAMLMDKGLDTGDILAYSVIDGTNKSSYELFDELTEIASKLTLKTIEYFDDLAPIKQHSSISNYAGKIKKSDGEIDFYNASEIYKKYLAYEGWPNVFMNNGTKIPKLEIYSNDKNDKKGIILDIKDDSIIISCIIGSLKIYSFHSPSKQKINAPAYARGKRLNIGDSIL